MLFSEYEIIKILNNVNYLCYTTSHVLINFKISWKNRHTFEGLSKMISK